MSLMEFAQEFAKWMGGALLVFAGALSLGTGAGIMWRAWVATHGGL